MKKLILKTALIALGTIASVLCILYGVLSLFFPLTMATFFDNLGMQDATVSFYELHYENTKDINDLGVLCVKVNEIDDAVRAKKYLTILTESENFDEYVAGFDQNNRAQISGEEYFNGKLAIAIMTTDGVEEFIAFAKEEVKDEYGEFNCFYLALSTDGLFRDSDLVEVRSALLEIEQNISDAEKVFIARDLEYTEVNEN